MVTDVGVKCAQVVDAPLDDAMHVRATDTLPVSSALAWVTSCDAAFTVRMVKCIVNYNFDDWLAFVISFLKYCPCYRVPPTRFPRIEIILNMSDSACRPFISTPALTIDFHIRTSCNRGHKFTVTK